METRSIFIDGESLSPAESQKVYNHSPDGFNFGYGGSGPAQLALAILLKFTSKKNALILHQKQKIGYSKKDLSSKVKVKIRRKQGFSNRRF